MARAVDADKLGGYAASAYLKKGEVRNVNAKYSETDWLTPGVYNWVVPEGVNSILVTTVGGGGGYGTYYYPTGLSDSSGVDTHWHMFSGGGGGGIVPQVNVDVTQGETLQLIVGKGGANSIISTYYNDSYIASHSAVAGSDGGYSCIARNGSCIASTVAYGGKGGSGNIVFTGYYLNNPNIPVYELTGGLPGNSLAGKGGSPYFLYKRNMFEDWNAGSSSKYTSGGLGFEIQSIPYNSTSPWVDGGIIAHGKYMGAGGGASWGEGGSCKTMKRNEPAGIGGGGARFLTYGQILAGDGMVKILSIGTTMAVE